MGTGVYKQPNGLLCLFSSCSDDIWAWNKTVEEVWTILVFIDQMSPEGALKAISAALNLKGREAMARKAYGDYTWGSRVKRVGQIHGKERASMLRKECREPVDHPAFSRPVFKTLHGIRLGEAGKTEHPPEWDEETTYIDFLFDLPGKDEEDVLRQYHKMTGGIYLDGGNPSKTRIVVEE